MEYQKNEQYPPSVDEAQRKPVKIIEMNLRRKPNNFQNGLNISNQKQ